MTRIFYDSEFIETGRRREVYPISLGFVSDAGDELYIEIDDSEIPWHLASQWVLDNVRPHLGKDPRREVLSVADAAGRIEVWVRRLMAEGKPEIWAYYADYDWVVLCQTFGTMMDLPTGWPKFCMDLKQRCVDLGDPRLPPQESTEHLAIDDAWWNKKASEFLDLWHMSTKEERKLLLFEEKS